MSPVPRWFDRKFEFTFPAEQYPNLCMRLRGTPARLDELVRGAQHEALVRKPGEKWSAQEHAGHLLDLEPLWLGRVEDFVRGGEVLTAADLSNRKTEEARHNERSAQEILSDFRKARKNLLDRLQKLDSGMISRTMLHPRLKTPMRLVDHLFFVAEHDDHHLAKMWELLRGQ
ncbi:MAG TPA: DinB family protein [Terriglobales bacterium]|nr:DinB family protein [Terriglobales bacterium]